MLLSLLGTCPFETETYPCFVLTTASPSTQGRDWHSWKICWMNECVSRLVFRDNSVASGFGGTDSFGKAGWLGFSSLHISSFSALRFLLLLWGIVCFLLPAHQTHFNELFLFICLPEIKSFPLPQNVHAQGPLAWQLCSLIRIHWCQVCIGLSLWPPTDVVRSPQSLHLNTWPRSVLLCFTVAYSVCLAGRGWGLDEGETKSGIWEAPPTSAQSQLWEEEGRTSVSVSMWVCAWVNVRVCVHVSAILDRDWIEGEDPDTRHWSP